MANELAVNLAHSRPNPDKGQLLTGIDKRPTDGPIAVRAPGPMDGGAGSGLVGDFIGDSQVHGGDDQAVYAYAREDLDVWRRELERDLGNGMFGENITTKGLDVTGARIGERWQVGSDGLVRCRGPVSRVGRLRPGWRSRAGSRHSPGPQRPARTSG